MSADYDCSGDYGYDLIHEVRAALALPTRRTRFLPVTGGRSPGRELDTDGDLGYDQAHDL